MINFDDVKEYLPKYLSDETRDNLYGSLSDFPDNIDNRIYTSTLKDDHILYQGDGVEGVLLLNLPDTTTKEGKGIIVSNSCDIYQENKRVMPIRIVYAPIFNLDHYEDLLRKKYVSDSTYTSEYITQHIQDIKKQFISHLFFLPPCEKINYNSFVSFDRLLNCPSDSFVEESIPNQRLFSLSNYGFYLFLFKLSIHLTRIREKIDRE